MGVCLVAVRLVDSEVSGTLLTSIGSPSRVGFVSEPNLVSWARDFQILPVTLGRALLDVRPHLPGGDNVVFIGEWADGWCLGCGVGFAGRPSYATLANTPPPFAVGGVLHTQVVADGIFGTIDVLGALFIGLGGSE
jgi:hypothetical protein